MKNTTLRFACLCVLALCVATPTMAATPNVVYATANSSYGVIMDGKFGTQPMHANMTLDITRKSDSGVAIDQKNLGTKADLATDGTFQNDGTIKPVQPVPTLIYTNDLVLMTASNAARTVGSSWTAILNIITAPGSYLAVPVSVKVADVRGQQVELQATGDQSGFMSYAGMQFPVDVHVRAALVQNNTTLVSGAFNVLENLKSAVGNSNMQWTVSINANPAQ